MMMMNDYDCVMLMVNDCNDNCGDGNNDHGYDFK